MASAESTTNDEFFALSCAVRRLADCAKAHSPETFKSAAQVLDVRPSGLLRGMAYLGYLLSQAIDDTGAAENRTYADAAEALAEINALVAVLIDIQNEHDCMDMVQAELAKQASASKAKEPQPAI